MINLRKSITPRNELSKKQIRTGHRVLIHGEEIFSLPANQREQIIQIISIDEKKDKVDFYFKAKNKGFGGVVRNQVVPASTTYEKYKKAFIKKMSSNTIIE